MRQILDTTSEILLVKEARGVHMHDSRHCRQFTCISDFVKSLSTGLIIIEVILTADTNY